jgi:acyl carrier protein
LVGGRFEIDSIDVMELVILLERDYGVFIDSKELGAEVLKSVRAMASFIASKQADA